MWGGIFLVYMAAVFLGSLSWRHIFWQGQKWVGGTFFNSSRRQNWPLPWYQWHRGSRNFFEKNRDIWYRTTASIDVKFHVLQNDTLFTKFGQVERLQNVKKQIHPGFADRPKSGPDHQHHPEHPRVQCVSHVSCHQGGSCWEEGKRTPLEQKAEPQVPGQVGHGRRQGPTVSIRLKKVVKAEGGLFEKN